MEKRVVNVLTKIEDRQVFQLEVNTAVLCGNSFVYDFFKRLFDIFVSLICILVLAPVFLIIGICIKVYDGGSILHFREIVGYQNQRFFALKFRTMIIDADAYLEKYPALMQKYQENMKLQNDPRITSIGNFLRRTSLDELPQLFNVLIGQMSLVGPRIIHPSELKRYGEYAQKRLSVKPGITGLWQISGRQHVSYDERIQLDLQYIATRSFSMDFILLLKTLRVVFDRSGI